MEKFCLLSTRSLGLLALLVFLSVSSAASASRVGVYCSFAKGAASVSDNGKVRTWISLSTDGEALLQVENLADEIVYVDRGNSFSYVNGASAPLFIPSTDTESHTFERGVLKDIGHGISWMRGESHTATRTVFDMRVLPVAPHGVSVVYVWKNLAQMLRPDVVLTGKEDALLRYHCKGRFADSQKTFKKGDERSYTPETTPLLLSAQLSYTFKDITSEQKEAVPLLRASVTDYVSHIRVGSCRGARQYSTAAPGFCFLSGKSKGSILTEWATMAASVVLVGWMVHAMNDRPDVSMPW